MLEHSRTGMQTRGEQLGHIDDRVALKDEHLVYRACSRAFARALGYDSPDQIIGKTDFDLFPDAVARAQLALDSQAIFSAQADISTLELEHDDASTMIVRTPVIGADKRVRGIDIRLLGGAPDSHAQSAITVDYRMLVNEGLQGSLIFSPRGILFANDTAAQLLGYRRSSELIGQARLSDLFRAEDLQAITSARQAQNITGSALGSRRLSLNARTVNGETVRLLTRATPVDWGDISATLLSFVDVAGSGALASEAGVDRTETAAGSAMAIGQGAADQASLPSDVRQLRASEQRYRHFARASADFFWELDAHLMFRFVSDELERILGVPREHLIGRTHQQLVEHPSNANDAQHWAEHLQLLADHQPFRDFEFRWTVRGEPRVIRYSGIPVFDRSQQFLGYRGVGQDVTAAVHQAEAIAYHANHDALTGLVNRRHFEHLVDEAWQSSRTDRRAHALCFMDLDNFKIVNDTCGHQAGDELLRQLGRLFDSLVRKSDVLARLGGDEFGVFLYNCDVPQALKLANQIRHEVENFQFLWQENRFTVGVSIGLVVVDDRWENLDALFRAADSACYIAKNEGRNRVVVYREGEGNASNRKIETHWVEEINTALESDRVHLACQKILPLHNQPDGLRFEMLLRLEMPDGRIVSPQAFFPSADRYGLSSALDERALDLTLAWLCANPQVLHSLRHCSLNLASASFADMDFARKLIRKIRHSGVAPDKLCFEMTETATIANLANASEFMQALSDVGCRFSIDDFGSGLSSFAYLRKLPVDFLKIDGLLIKDILDDPTDYTMVKAINEISKSMGKRTVAEFVESPRLLSAVRDMGIDFAQGYHIGEPELIDG